MTETRGRDTCNNLELCGFLSLQGVKWNIKRSFKFSLWSKVKQKKLSFWRWHCQYKRITLDWSILWKELCLVLRWLCSQNGSPYERKEAVFYFAYSKFLAISGPSVNLSKRLCSCFVSTSLTFFITCIMWRSKSILSY